ncbi:MAG: UPF0175 family protein [Proteobacteria bacterium]|nr:UPF0175 family protein [Pseudomonadota bacterium]
MTTDQTSSPLDEPVRSAARLFDEGQISLSHAARLAGMSLSAFIDLLGSLRIPVTRLDAGELEREVTSFAQANEPRLLPKLED